MKYALLALCGMAFVLSACENKVREAKKEEKKAETPADTFKPGTQEAPEQK